MATETQSENESEPGGRAAAAVERFVSWPRHHDGRLLCTREQPKPDDAPLVNWVHLASVELIDKGTGSRYEKVRCPNCGSEWTRSKAS